MTSVAPSPRIVALLRGRGAVLVLTGAGVSSESGISTFRDAGGVWDGIDPMRVATPRAIAAIEATGRPFLLATQNVDGLHERAGSRSVVRLHGSLWSLRCTGEGTEHDDLRPTLDPLPPRCATCGAMLRPAVVWFDEPLPVIEFSRAERAARAAELVLVVGTSSLVYPAASLQATALTAGAYVVEINPERTPFTAAASEHLPGPAGVVLPALLAAAGIPMDRAA